MRYETVVHGPLHPDLFSDPTPIRHTETIELRAWLVRIRLKPPLPPQEGGLRSTTQYVELAARSRLEAHQHARRMLQYVEIQDLEVASIRVEGALRRDPTPEEIEAWEEIRRSEP
ncbi:MAG TPA: hypothetical protein ENK54_04535 [Thiotrichales bacterium]|nr:hypothetical protein [Thiotrichales bacterium]